MCRAHPAQNRFIIFTGHEINIKYSHLSSLNRQSSYNVITLRKWSNRFKCLSEFVDVPIIVMIDCVNFI